MRKVESMINNKRNEESQIFLKNENSLLLLELKEDFFSL